MEIASAKYNRLYGIYMVRVDPELSIRMMLS
jgi:hypothetical protein